MIGVHSHGAVRVEYYSERINKGGITNNPKLGYKQTGTSTLTIEADNHKGIMLRNLGEKKRL